MNRLEKYWDEAYALHETWVNGNRSDLLEQLANMPAAKGRLVTAMVMVIMAEQADRREQSVFLSRLRTEAEEEQAWPGG